jgi:tripartite-type tricarboxylate transporter receptor subunit TctC
VRLVVGFTPGGGNDIVARVIGKWLTEQIRTILRRREPAGSSGQHRDGIGRAIAARRLHLLQVGLANAVNATLYESLPYNFIRDIAPVAGLIRYPQVMVVHPSMSARTPSDFIAYARANPAR